MRARQFNQSHQPVTNVTSIKKRPPSQVLRDRKSGFTQTKTDESLQNNELQIHWSILWSLLPLFAVSTNPTDKRREQE